MDNRRLILFVIFSLSLVMLWDAWVQYKNPRPQAPVAAAQSGDSSTPQPSASLVAGGSPSLPAATPAGQSAEQYVVETDLLKATLSSEGGNLVRLEFKNYKGTVDKNQPMVLFDDKHQYAAQSGLIGAGLPNHRSAYQRLPGDLQLKEGGNELTVRLQGQAEGGVRVTKTYTFQRNSYLIKVGHELTNGSTAPITAHAYFQFMRDDKAPEGESSMVSTFTGPAVYTEQDKFKKIAFSDIQEGKAKFITQTDNGWVAMVQHYFVAAWLPQDKTARENFMRRIEGSKAVTAGVIMPMATVAPGASASISLPLYAGPQIQSNLTALAPGLDLVVDYGWLTVIAAPLFWVLEWIHKLVGNWGWAIVALTVAIKLVFFPLSAASYKSMAKMRQVTPKLMALKERYGDDRQQLNQEMMKLYQTEKINPLGGCLPILVQIPVFIALYWVLLGAVEMRDAPWIFWITDLSSADPFYILPILMVVSMIVQTKLNPTPPDPIQAKVMMAMPFIFGVMFFWFPSGLVLYWTVNNVLSIAQQWQITRLVESGQKV